MLETELLLGLAGGSHTLGAPLEEEEGVRGGRQAPSHIPVPLASLPFRVRAGGLYAVLVPWPPNQGR